MMYSSTALSLLSSVSHVSLRLSGFHSNPFVIDIYLSEIKIQPCHGDKIGSTFHVVSALIFHHLVSGIGTLHKLLYKMLPKSQETDLDLETSLHIPFCNFFYICDSSHSKILIQRQKVYYGFPHQGCQQTWTHQPYQILVFWQYGMRDPEDLCWFFVTNECLRLSFYRANIHCGSQFGKF